MPITPEPAVSARPALRRRSREPRRHHDRLRSRAGTTGRRRRQRDRAPACRWRRHEAVVTGPDFVARHASPGRRRRLAAVGPPVDAVGRTELVCAGRRRGRARRRRPRSRCSSRRGPRRHAPVPVRPIWLVEPLSLVARQRLRRADRAVDAEIGEPQWVFGRPRFALAPTTARSRSRLAPAGSIISPWPDAPSSCVARPSPGQRGAPRRSATQSRCVVAGSRKRSRGRHRSIADGAPATSYGRPAPWRRSGVHLLPEAIDVPHRRRPDCARPLLPAPHQPELTGPDGERPPLIVTRSTAARRRRRRRLLDGIQYWTSRGFAVVDVNYGGSTGYGRAYRDRLNGQWGVVDVDDCLTAARHLARTARSTRIACASRAAQAGGSPRLARWRFATSVQRRRRSVRRGRSRGARPGTRTSSRAAISTGSSALPGAQGHLRRPLPDPPRRRLRPTADRPPGSRRHDRAAQPGAR